MLVLVLASLGCRQPVGSAHEVSAEDRACLATLDASGGVAAGRHVVIRYPNRGLGESRARSLLSELEPRIAKLKQVVGKPDWNYGGDSRVYLYICDETFIAHGLDGNIALLPLTRVLEDRAPFTHEAAHVVLGHRPFGGLPQWLVEGSAEAATIAAGGFVRSPLIDVAPDRIDARCLELLETDAGRRVLPYLGGTGFVSELATEERMTYAPAFYTCATSLAQHVIKTQGFAALQPGRIDPVPWLHYLRSASARSN